MMIVDVACYQLGNSIAYQIVSGQGSVAAMPGAQAGRTIVLRAHEHADLVAGRQLGGDAWRADHEWRFWTGLTGSKRFTMDAWSNRGR
jgi:hypothetical protein